MKMPGFTAEASLTPNRIAYRATGARRTGNAAIISQIIGLNRFDSSSSGYDFTIIGARNRLELPDVWWWNIIKPRISARLGVTV